MKRNFEYKRRGSEKYPPEKLRQILSKIYTEKTVNELMPKLIGSEITEKGGVQR